MVGCHNPEFQDKKLLPTTKWKTEQKVQDIQQMLIIRFIVLISAACFGFQMPVSAADGHTKGTIAHTYPNKSPPLPEQ
jgi:hypothetical protein